MLSCGSWELKISCPETKKHPVTPKVQVSLAGPQPGGVGDGGRWGKHRGGVTGGVGVVVVVVVGGGGGGGGGGVSFKTC